LSIKNYYIMNINKWDNKKAINNLSVIDLKVKNVKDLPMKDINIIKSMIGTDSHIINNSCIFEWNILYAYFMFLIIHIKKSFVKLIRIAYLIWFDRLNINISNVYYKFVFEYKLYSDYEKNVWLGLNAINKSLLFLRKTPFFHFDKRGEQIIESTYKRHKWFIFIVISETSLITFELLKSKKI
jgi:hypothetical protein